MAEAEDDAEAEITAEEWADESSSSSSQYSDGLACSFTPQWEASMPVTSRQVPFWVTKQNLFTICDLQASLKY